MAPRRTVGHGTVRSALAGTVILAAGAFVLSFASLTDLAVMAGIDDTLAWIWPLIVDGVIVVATTSIVAMAGHGRRALTYPWALLAGGALVSVAANALHAILAADGVVPAVVSALVASVPPIVLLAVTHLSVVLAQKEAPRAAVTSKTVTATAHALTAPEPVTVPAPAAKTTPRPSSSVDAARIRDLAAEGLSQREIALKLSTSKSSVARALAAAA